MKNKLLNGLILSFVLSLLIACNSKNEEPAAAVDKEQIKKEIQAKEDGFAEVFNAREIKNIGYYAEDAVSFSQNHAPLISRAAIVEYLKSNMDSIPVSNKISFTTNEVFVSNDGIMVVETGYFLIVDADTNDTINSGNYMSLFEKREGKYVCLRDMSVSDIPLE
jgi:ketosteroid isomerase-like protein